MGNLFWCIEGPLIALAVYFGWKGIQADNRRVDDLLAWQNQTGASNCQIFEMWLTGRGP
jgi:hypothetical protein